MDTKTRFEKEANSEMTYSMSIFETTVHFGAGGGWEQVFAKCLQVQLTWWRELVVKIASL